MAWDKTKPENDMLLINFPPACRANWEALELLTDPLLQITNEKVAPGAGIEDTKLAQITSRSSRNIASIMKTCRVGVARQLLQRSVVALFFQLLAERSVLRDHALTFRLACN